MASWKITIRGEGPHHGKQARDAEALAAKWVEEAEAAGHKVDSASIVTGAGEKTLKAPPTKVDES